MNEGYDLEDYKLCFEAEGFNLLVIDIIRNLTKRDNFASALRNGKLEHYIGRDVLNNFLSRVIEICSDYGRFNKLFNNLGQIDRNIKESFKSVMNRLDNQSYKYFLNSLKEILEYYTLIDFDLSIEDEKKIMNEDPEVSKRIRRLGDLKNRAREILNNALLSEKDLLKQFLVHVSKKYEVNESSLLYYIETELTNLIINNLKVTEEEINERKKASMVISNCEKLYYLFGQKALDKIKELKSHDKLKQPNIKGDVAYRFDKPIIGRVMIFRIDFENLNKQIEMFLNELQGSKDKIILVVGATSPEMTPIFKKVAAIVTDLGGLNTHAAIIAREMKIPCIVGTKIATKTLKDRDLVELDANTGIVRIIKQHGK